MHDDQVVQLLTITGETIVTTPTPPFYTSANQWVPAGQLHPGDLVRRADGTYGMVEVTAFVYQPQPMYNLTVATAHTYFVGDGQWLVHNLCKFTPVKGFKDRVESVKATITLGDLDTGTVTNPSSRNWVQNIMGNPTDQAGHVIGNRLGGPGGYTTGNIFPQNPAINTGAYRVFEGRIYDHVSAGNQVNITVNLRYANDQSTRPFEIDYKVYSDDGDLLFSQLFQNP